MGVTRFGLDVCHSIAAMIITRSSLDHHATSIYTHLALALAWLWVGERVGESRNRGLQVGEEMDMSDKQQETRPNHSTHISSQPPFTPLPSLLPLFPTLILTPLFLS